ncbi:hypothetical protein SteCoe_10513 [Stentor coeruleus]|uniref:Uncharacterized protein n=1 Tax=Stentor coeruleus TaxID=5963 RepID=A0A1R2CFQ1_9CILI|nr:hypothetical protein SteCoe_10513 [Stentor coeruleus]
MSEIGKAKNISNKLKLPAIKLKKPASKSAKKPSDALVKNIKEVDLNNSYVSAKSNLVNALLFHASSITIENSQGSVNIDLDCSYNKKSSPNNSKNPTKAQKYYATRPRSSVVEESKILNISVADDDENDKVRRLKHQHCGSCACNIF